ncbi:DeoR family transcriptional regulator [Auraticoccus sp. F435]|uniref:DeoR family transcriptional regulator n=1 Tax=Auraticoccus cholistanensis TaxID=2656650 RepID=A0A6A9UU80_9ACTN|nr:substrate-binding domain-containing protein [Auraticoccus cholistanensis]MVA75144.1 DeoR family transcriptional regulator [Auraticoccus cholistanensis]
MIPAERQARILHELELRGTLAVADFARRWRVSGMTVRRDLVQLAERGLLERVHGGAVAVRPREPRSRSREPVATLGLVVPSASYYYADVVRGARAAAAELGVRLVLAISEYSPRLEVEQVDRLVASAVDGLLVTPSLDLGQDTSTYRVLEQAPVPVVVVERRVEEGGPEVVVGGVRSDHQHGGALAVHHLADLGHRRLVLAWRESTTATQVREGVARAMAARCPEGLLVEVPIALAGVAPEESAARLQAVLDTARDVAAQAVMVLPDEAAISLVGLAQDRGLRVPEDLSVVAYDDEVAALAAIPLTAVCPPKSDVGAAAVRACLDLVRHAGRPGTTLTRTTLLPRLNVRASTAPPSR